MRHGIWIQCWSGQNELRHDMTGDSFWIKKSTNLLWCVEETLEIAQEVMQEMKENSVFLRVWIEEYK